jgi:acyl-coenzyme A synthetase/AMP-(fatty) acid ligase
LIHVGSETIYKKEVEQYKKYFSDDCLFVARYGTTEISPIRQFVVDKKTEISNGTVPLGYEVVDTEVLLLNDDGLQVGVSQIGEIAVRSRYLAPGYWQNPELTKASFLIAPKGGKGEDERIYRTGDLGVMQPDGRLVHLGRKDFQVKIRGHRVEVAEIEMALLKLGLIKEVVVAAGEDRRGDQTLIAYIVPSTQAIPTVSSLRQALIETLPDHMVPSTFKFLDALPKTATGKVDRRALPAPHPTRARLDQPFIAPQTPVEEAVGRIWEEALGVERVGSQDNFYELGGEIPYLPLRLSRGCGTHFS